MGQFETVVEFYRDREPYPQSFFESVALRLSLSRGTTLLDVGCGPGNLVIGFAQFVGSCTAIDPEPEMLRAAKSATATAGIPVTLLETSIENLPLEDTFDLVTVGRALHWLAREKTLAVFERCVTPGGCIAICGSSATDSPVNAWVSKFKQLRQGWASDPDETRYHPDLDQWFAPSRFRQIHQIEIRRQHLVTIPELTRRALSFSVTSPAVLGERRPQFEKELQMALEPFAENGMLVEEIVAKATVFA